MGIKRRCSRTLHKVKKRCLKFFLNLLLIAFYILPLALSISFPFILWNGLAENKLEYFIYDVNDYASDDVIDGIINATNTTLFERNYSTTTQQSGHTTVMTTVSNETTEPTPINCHRNVNSRVPIASVDFNDTNCKLREVTYKYTLTGTQTVCLVNKTSRTCQEDVYLTDNPYQIGLVILGFSPYITLLLAPIMQMFGSRIWRWRDNKERVILSYSIAVYVGILIQPGYYIAYLQAASNCCLSMIDLYTHLKILLAVQIEFLILCQITVCCKVCSYRIKGAMKRTKQWLREKRNKLIPPEHKCDLLNLSDTYYSRADDYTIAIANESTPDLIEKELGIEYIPISYKRDIKAVFTSLWQKDLVGKGRDARGLTHNTIDIVNIVKIENKGFAENYFQRRKMLYKLARTSHAGRIAPPEDFPVATQAVVDRFPDFSKNIDNNVNEYYLFHGTKKDNVESIEKTGFRVGERGMLGRGIYFSDSPVKADQYSDRGESGCIILSRVLLGDWVRLEMLIPAASIATSTPCKLCFGVAGRECKPPKDRFDSLAYMKGLFPEYVIFEEWLAYPEFVIYYKRIGEDPESE